MLFISLITLTAAAPIYTPLTTSCKNAVAVSGKLPCTSVADCEAQCTAQAAAAPGTGQTPCVGVDTDGKSVCFLKSQCEGTPGTCASHGTCGYVTKQAPTPPPTVPPPIPPAPFGMTLREAADMRGRFIGAATNVAGLTSTTDLQYKAVVQKHFSLTTAENACKVGPIHPAPGPDGYSWEGCDTIFAEAEKANQTVRGHNLCWHTENPSWLNDTLTKDELIAALQSHITAVIGHYGTRAYAWDVVNEAISDNVKPGGLPNSSFKKAVPWYPQVPNYVDLAFLAADKARKLAGAPGVKLFYNDYSVGDINAKSTAMYNMVKDMQERLIPIDGIGLQFHISLSNAGHWMSTVSANIARFAALGLEVHITELDIKCVPKGSTKPCTPEMLEAQAQLYAAVVHACLEHPMCKSIETWGFTDKDTWIGSSTMPLPFNTTYGKKPAFDGIVDAFLH